MVLFDDDFFAHFFDDLGKQVVELDRPAAADVIRLPCRAFFENQMIGADHIPDIREIYCRARIADPDARFRFPEFDFNHLFCPVGTDKTGRLAGPGMVERPGEPDVHPVLSDKLHAYTFRRIFRYPVETGRAAGRFFRNDICDNRIAVLL